MKDEVRWKQMKAYGLVKAKEFFKEKGWKFKHIEHPYFDFEVMPGAERHHQLVKVATRNFTNSDGTPRHQFMIYHSEDDGCRAMEYADSQHAQAVWLLYVLKPHKQTYSLSVGHVGDLEDMCRVSTVSEH